ncbi:MAG: tRNA uridine-5-carboxymethylaminomethyl(34) synthesis enzyme MnmG [Candidatus Marinimicrobia bacterium]|jgi:tRNA uridine 5-carboxymethylaminomethyl modification enzyme|nr:tRNA uridine-5-carboxymethylaminomethyl(34) synthesis enzyme MnmG [Candidatus Neomarinimicrobiota bacterium]
MRYLLLFALGSRFHVKHHKNNFDIIVVGGGHAGVEAAHISTARGLTVALISMDLSALARMSCNPAIGGLAKGQMVREIDILGGLMGRATDACGVQFKLLNKSKGEAVWSPRAQVDKRKYESYVSGLVFSNNLLSLVSGEVVGLGIKNNNVVSCVLRSGEKIFSNTVIITSGTFMSGVVHVGERKVFAGRMGEKQSSGLTRSLNNIGIRSGRLKTGTPPRLVRSSIDWSKTEPVFGDKKPTPFSYSTTKFNPPNRPCHTVRTNQAAHEIISDNINRSPMSSGDIKGVGPRYCPSIEDKISRFSSRPSHLLYLEPEWGGSDQIYLNGFSTSLPEDVQISALRKVSGLEKVRFFRPGYAIEYDFFPPSQLKSTLESKMVSGLYFAGQVNGTSGYEEAAAQGLLAGINAACFVNREAPLILTRTDSYIGVMVDDLITKDTLEPYRMFTSRAEHRLSLRYSNADSRLLKHTKNYMLLPGNIVSLIEKKLRAKTEALALLKHKIKPGGFSGETGVTKTTSGESFLKRPDAGINMLPKNYFNQLDLSFLPDWLRSEFFIDLFATIKYGGYISRQLKSIKKNQKNEHLTLPLSFNYKTMVGLSGEAKEKLSFVRPETLGQASRISGVTPADISVLLVRLRV